MSNNTVAPNLSGLTAWENMGAVGHLFAALEAAATGGSTSVSNLSWDIWVEVATFNEGNYEVYLSPGATWASINTTGTPPSGAYVVAGNVVTVDDVFGNVYAGSPGSIVIPHATNNYTGTGNVVLASSPSVSALTVTSSFMATGLVSNADLTNPSTTVNGQTCTLGSTCTVPASATSITVGTTTVAGGTSGYILYDSAGTLGNLATTGSGSVVLANSPTLGAISTGVITESGASASSFTETTAGNGFANFLTPNLTTGNGEFLWFGHDISLKNVGDLKFTYEGSSSNASFVSLGLWGIDQILNLYGSGDVTINTPTDNGYLLEVNGTTKSDGIFTAPVLYVPGGGNGTNPSIWFQNIASSGFTPVGDGIWLNNNSTMEVNVSTQIDGNLTVTSAVNTANYGVTTGGADYLSVGNVFPLVFDKDIEEDYFQFNSPQLTEVETSGTWSSVSTPTTLFMGAQIGGYTIPYNTATQGVRFTWTSWPYDCLEMLHMTYSASGHSMSVTVQESSNSGSTWNTVFTGGPASQWPGYFDFRQGFNTNGFTYFRVIIGITWNPTWAGNAIVLYNLRYFGQYGIGNAISLYTWDQNRTIYMPSFLAVGGGVAFDPLTVKTGTNQEFTVAPGTAYGGSNGVSLFSANDANNAFEQLVLAGSQIVMNATGGTGNVGIGTNNPGALLEVNGNTIVDGKLSIPTNLGSYFASGYLAMGNTSFLTQSYISSNATLTETDGGGNFFTPIYAPGSGMVMTWGAGTGDLSFNYYNYAGSSSPINLTSFSTPLSVNAGGIVATSVTGYNTGTWNGYTGAAILRAVSATTDWSNMPVGYQEMFFNAQTATGTPSTNYGYFFKMGNRDAGGGWGGLWMDYSGGNMYFGSTTVSTSYATWQELLSSTNFNSFAPTLTGGGASGTWNINITGTSPLTVGSTPVSSGTSGYVLYDNGGTLGNLSTTGSGSVVLSASPTLTGTTAISAVSESGNMNFGLGSLAGVGSAFGGHQTAGNITLLTENSSSQYLGLLFNSGSNAGSDNGALYYYNHLPQYAIWSTSSAFSTENSAMIVSAGNDARNADSDAVVLYATAGVFVDGGVTGGVPPTNAVALYVLGSLETGSIAYTLGNNYSAFTPRNVLDDGSGNVSVAGDVGIGTTSPRAKLEIASGIEGQTGPVVGVQIDGPNLPVTSNSAQDITVAFAAAGSARIRAYRGASWDTYLQFLTNGVNQGADSPKVQMTIDQVGNVGIGTTAPGALLEVNGTGVFDGTLYATGFTDNQIYQFTSSTSAVGANSCSGVTTVSIPSTNTNSVFVVTSTNDTASITGWGANGGMVMDVWPTSGTFNFKLCNQSGNSITPGAVTWNVKVL